MTGSHEVFEATKNTDQFGVVTEEILTGRKYLVIRGIGSTPVSRSSRKSRQSAHTLSRGRVAETLRSD